MALYDCMKLRIDAGINLIKRRMADLPAIFRRGTAAVTLVVAGVTGYWLLLAIFAIALRFRFDLIVAVVATLAAVVAGVLVYLARISISTAVSFLFEGRRYKYRRRLSEYAEGIQNIFSLKEQGGGLLSLVTKATGCLNAGLLFPEDGSEDFLAQLLEPAENNPLAGLRLNVKSPVLDYLSHEQKQLTKETISAIPEMRNYFAGDESFLGEIALFQPLVSRGRLIAILVLSRKPSGHYLLEELSLLKDVASHVAVAMEKEYLREQLHSQEQKLAIISRSAAIITSSLDIQGSFASFVAELSKLTEIDWAAIVLIQDASLCFMASWPDS